jgi:hypothetical protein
MGVLVNNKRYKLKNIAKKSIKQLMKEQNAPNCHRGFVVYICDPGTL